GSQSAGSQSAGSQSAGSQSAGSQSAGSQSAGSQSAGSQSAGSQSAGSLSAGSQSEVLQLEKPQRTRRSFGWIGYAAAAALVFAVGGSAAAAVLILSAPDEPGEEAPSESETAPTKRATAVETPQTTPAPAEAEFDEQLSDEQLSDEELSAAELSAAEPVELNSERAENIALRPRLADRNARPSAVQDEPPRAEPVDEQAPAATAEDLLQEANQARDQGQVNLAVTRYRELQRQFPGSGAARVSQVSAGRLLLRSGRPAEALAHFDAYLARGGALSEAALVGKATALRQLGQAGPAADTWREVVRRFPGSPSAVRAARELERR
ncbi:MAG: tetratricopeptide repeat protein, partial [Myxococcota bacterium]